jgi:hypothetical protein
LGATLYRAANVRNPGHNVNSSGSDRLLQSDPILGRNAQIAVTTDRRMAWGAPVGRERSAPRQAPPPNPPACRRADIAIKSATTRFERPGLPISRTAARSKRLLRWPTMPRRGRVDAQPTPVGFYIARSCSGAGGRSLGDAMEPLREIGKLGRGGFKWSSQHDLCRLIGETGQAPLRVSSNQVSFGAAS